MRIVLIGEAPGPSVQDGVALSPYLVRTSGYYLCKLMGMEPAQYVRDTVRTNLLSSYPGHNTGGRGRDKFRMKEARSTANAMLPLLAGCHAVLLGRKVSQAFGFTDDAPWFTTRSVGAIRFNIPSGVLKEGPIGYRLTVIPHPSGRCHWYNDPKNILEAQTFFGLLLKQRGIGSPHDDHNGRLINPEFGETNDAQLHSQNPERKRQNQPEV